MHGAILLAIIVEYHFAAPLIVVENTNQHDVISAVVLGDTAKSKILPHEEPVKPPTPVVEPPKPIVKKEVAPPKPVVDEKAIALKAAKEKKKLEEKKEKELAEKKDKELKKKQQELLAKNLLDDIKKETKKKTVAKKPDLSNKFAKMLKEQSEQSLRQNLLDDSIKLRGKTARLSQGIVDKYKALIIQSIGEHWLVPLSANRSLTSELMIRLAPSGEVLDVKVTRSSGDPSLDSSARSAVLKASPLPVPANPDEFEPFRQFVLKVKPENIIET